MSFNTVYNIIDMNAYINQEIKLLCCRFRAAVMFWANIFHRNVFKYHFKKCLKIFFNHNFANNCNQPNNCMKLIVILNIHNLITLICLYIKQKNI